MQHTGQNASFSDSYFPPIELANLSDEPSEIISDYTAGLFVDSLLINTEWKKSSIVFAIYSILGLVCACFSIALFQIGVKNWTFFLFAISACIICVINYGVFKELKREKTFATHLPSLFSFLQGKTLCFITDIAKHLGINTPEALSILDFAITNNLIREGHIVSSGRALLLSNLAYSTYLCDKEKYDDLWNYTPNTASENLAANLLSGYKLCETIREAQEVTNNKETWLKLQDMLGSLNLILQEASSSSQKAEMLYSFFSYYVPTTSKLLNTFISYSRVNSNSNNQTEILLKIENLLDNLSSTYSSIYDSLFRDEAISLSSEIEAMKLIMQKDGFV